MNRFIMGKSSFLLMTLLQNFEREKIFLQRSEKEEIYRLAH